MLRVGFARLDITPPLGNDLAGYYHRRIADGVLDPLYVNTLAVTDGNHTLILIAVDFIGIQQPYADRIRQEVAQRVGVGEEYVLVASIHQHTAPCLTDNPDWLTRLRDTEYINVTIRKLVDSAQMAMDDRCEATLSTALTQTAQPISFVRRYFTDDGTVVTNPRSKYTIVKRCAESDNAVRLVRFHRQGAKDVALVNFSTHPDVVTGTKWSADWPGFTRRFVEEDLQEVSCIFFTGAQGDANHVDYFKPKEERIKEGSGYAHSRYMGRTVADAVVETWDKTQPMAETGIFARHTVLYNLTNTEGIEYYDQAEAYEKEYSENVKNGVWAPDYTPAHPYLQGVAHAARILSLRNAPIYRPIPLTVMGIGKVALVGFGGEPFTSYSALLNDFAPDKFLLTVVCANGCEGYFPTAEAFSQGGYEVISSLFTPRLEAQILEAAQEMLKDF